MKYRTILAAVLAFVTPASAQEMCAPLDQALEQLHAQYGESPRVDGLASDGRLVIVTASPQGGWTMLVVDPTLVACLVAHGEGFRVHDVPVPGIDG